MSRHPFRWEALAFGLFFAAVVVHWSLWRSARYGPDELAYVGAGALIVLGLVGLAGSVVVPRRRLSRQADEQPATDDELEPPSSSSR
ncbi:MAG TPA: hypothetical protein VM093_03660 [Aeromicrobium sp.]|nr:hypothetical protein [Aeromicrobium sp.]